MGMFLAMWRKKKKKSSAGKREAAAAAAGPEAPSSSGNAVSSARSCCIGKENTLSSQNHQMAPTGGSTAAAVCTTINAAGNSNSASPLNVNDEYRRAVRTKSYTDIWAKVHHHIHRHRTHGHHQEHDNRRSPRMTRCHSTPITPATTSSTAHGHHQGFYIKQFNDAYQSSIKRARHQYCYSRTSTTASTPSNAEAVTPSSSPFSASTAGTTRRRGSFTCSSDDDDDDGLHRLQDYLDPADEDRLLDSAQASAPMPRSVHGLLHDYFAISLEACQVCARLLASVHRARRDQRAFLYALHEARDGQQGNDDDLAMLTDRENPLSRLRGVHFLRIHDLYSSLIRRLAASHRRIKRKAKILRGIRRASGAVLVVTCAAITIAILVVLSHGILAAPAVAAAAPAAFNIGTRRRQQRSRSSMTQQLPCALTTSSLLRPSQLIRLGDQLDAAAKGAYIMSRDFETMSRMVARLHDEIEHGKDVVRIFLRSGREKYVLREVVRELDGNETAFAEQLDELEEHVFWCLKTINGTRRLVAQKLQADDSGSSDQ